MSLHNEDTTRVPVTKNDNMLSNEPVTTYFYCAKHPQTTVYATMKGYYCPACRATPPAIYSYDCPEPVPVRENDNMLSSEWRKPGDKVSQADEVWWDKGILWVHINGTTNALNSYEAIWLLNQLAAARKAIWSQVNTDIMEKM